MVQRREDDAAIPLRIAFGIIFVAHGAQKLFDGARGAKPDLLALIPAS